MSESAAWPCGYQVAKVKEVRAPGASLGVRTFFEGCGAPGRKCTVTGAGGIHMILCQEHETECIKQGWQVVRDA